MILVDSVKQLDDVTDANLPGLLDGAVDAEIPVGDPDQGPHDRGILGYVGESERRHDAAGTGIVDRQDRVPQLDAPTHPGLLGKRAALGRIDEDARAKAADIDLLIPHLLVAPTDAGYQNVKLYDVTGSLALRVRLPANLEYLKAVLGGALALRMPEVPLDDASTEALYAYLVNTAWSAYEDANAHPRAVGRE